MKKTIETAVYEQLRQLILNGAFNPGQRLIERELCEQFQVSRTPIREVLKKLVLEGLLENKPYVGIMIPSLTAKDVQDLIDVREVVEGLAVRKAVELITDQEIETLQQIILRTAELVRSNDIKELIKLNDKFHKTIVDITKNNTLIDVLQRLSYRITLARATSLNIPARPQSTLREHEEIFAAIQQRDPELAEQKMRYHIRAAGEVAIKSIEGIHVIQPIKRK